MTGDSRLLVTEYGDTLRAYLQQHDEASLSLAYELGRRALDEGLGVLDIAAIHHGALAAELPNTNSVEGAADFLREVLSPFEMSLRGYRAANQELSRLNQTLSAQKQEIEFVNRELEAFSFSVSHDLRAPLRSLDGFARALQEGYATFLDARGHKYLKYICESAQEMNRLIEDLLKLSRAGRSELTRGNVDVSELSRTIAAKLRESEPQRAAEFAIEPDIQANADARLLGIALENLLGNAWKYSAKRERAVIEVGVKRADGRRVYFVRDNGAGFDMRHVQRIFKPFQRLHSSDEFQGSGIGLATVQRIVHRHHGEIWAEGEVGKGACFYFTLGEH